MLYALIWFIQNTRKKKEQKSFGCSGRLTRSTLRHFSDSLFSPAASRTRNILGRAKDLTFRISIWS
jgi:hypothetical protein